MTNTCVCKVTFFSAHSDNFYFFVLSLLKVLFSIFQKNSTFNRKKSPWKVKCTVRLIESTEYIEAVEDTYLFLVVFNFSKWKNTDSRIFFFKNCDRSSVIEFPLEGWFLHLIYKKMTLLSVFIIKVNETVVNNSCLLYREWFTLSKLSNFSRESQK